MKSTLKDAEKFIKILNNQTSKSKEKIKDLCNQIHQKESQSTDDVHLNQALKEITKECENLSKKIVNLKHEMESMMMKLKKGIEVKKNQKILLSPQKKNQMNVMEPIMN